MRSSDTSVRRAVFLIVMFQGLSCSPRRIAEGGFPGPEQSPLTGVLHLHCTWTEPYCGGADPGPERMPRAQPWSGPMYIRAAKPDSTGRFAINDLREPILDTIQMNSMGHGHLSLPAGSYLLLDQDRTDDRRYRALLRDHARPVMYTDAIDTACIRRWLHGPFGVLRIASDDTLHMEYPMHGQCPWYETPCVSYHGPLPP